VYYIGMEYSKDKILRDLNSFAENEYKKFSSALSPTLDKERVLGVRLPKIKKYAAEIVYSGEGERVLLESEPYLLEEKLLFAFILGKIKLPYEDKKSFVQKYIPYIESWSECDCAVSAFRFIEKHEDDFWQFLQPYLNSESEYPVRFALYCFTGYYLKGDRASEVISVAAKIKSEYYYVKMAVAFLLATAYIYRGEEVYAVLSGGALDGFTHNKTISKICESFRIPKEEKERVKRLRRRAE